MSFRLSPIMAALLAATLPSIAFTLSAAEHNQLIVNDPTGNTQITLNPGDTITHSDTGAALDVSVSGNSVTADNVIITATDAGMGVRASSGGHISLDNSTIRTIGNLSNQNRHALAAVSNDSLITANNSMLETTGLFSHGAYAQNGGRIELHGGEISTAGYGSAGIYVDRASALAKDISITAGTNGYGAYVNQGELELENVTITSGETEGVMVYGASSKVSLLDSHITSKHGIGLRLDGGQATMTGGSISANSSLLFLSGGSATLKDITLTAGSGTFYSINLNASNSSVDLDGVALTATQNVLSNGVWLANTNTKFTAKNFHFDVSAIGIDNRAGHAMLEDGSITTHETNGYALYVSRERGSSATITTDNVQINTFGDGGVGALSRGSGANIQLNNSRIITHGETGHGLFISGTRASIDTKNTTITTHGNAASGVSMSNNATVTLDNTHFTTHGTNSRGIWSYGTAATANNTITLTNGSSINTQNSTALLTSGGNHSITLDDVTIVARATGDTTNATLLHSRPVTVTSGGVDTQIATHQVTLDASESSLTGDVLMESGVADVSLKHNSVLTGALIERDTGRINSLDIDRTSRWNVRGNSTLGSLHNTGIIAFVSPNPGGDFKTLTVNNYIGGGTLVLNTQLGDDTSPTDKLIIDGGSASGNTGLRILNASGKGGQTTEGIRVIETINGGTTATDSFHLDSGSTGYRSSTTTLALNGYDYSLIRGGNGGTADDWYLTSEYTPPVDPDPPVDPVDPVDPEPPVDPIDPEPPIDPIDPIDPVDPEPPVDPVFKNVSPESGAYLGNQLAATRLFKHSLNDRSSMSTNSVDLDNGRRMWARAQGRHDSGLRMVEGNVRIKTDSTMLQLGGDLLRSTIGKEGALYAGVMVGYGDTHTRSTSTMRAPITGQRSQVRAKGKVHGYSVGVYGTFYQNDSTRLGAYADTWLQYGRYSNRISSELGSASYNANLWSASVEAGYAIKPFSDQSALSSLVVEPNAQAIYSHYDAKDVTLQGTRMRSGNKNSWSTRVGVRLYPQASADTDQPSVLPFVEANWLYSGNTATIQMGTNTLNAQPSRHALELKLGLHGHISQHISIGAHLFGQTSSHSQRGYGGMVQMGYRW